MKGGFLEITTSGETVEKVKMAILPIYESLKIKNLQTAKDHKMAISGVFRQSRKEAMKISYNDFVLLLREVPRFLKDHFEKEPAFPK